MKVLKVLFVLLLACAVFGAGGYFGWKLYLAPHQEQKQAEAAPPPTPAPTPLDTGAKVYEEAVAHIKAGKRDDGRAGLEAIIEKYPNSARYGDAKRVLGEMNANLFFSPRGAGAQVYAVQKGDALFKIANKFKVSPELLFRANNLEGINLQIGQQLTVPQGNFTLVIDRAAKSVRLMESGHFFREYPASQAKFPGAESDPPQQTRVKQKMAWRGGAQVAFGAKEFAESTRWIVPAITGYTLYTDWEAAGDKDRNDTKKPSTGLGLLPEYMSEICSLVNQGTEVRIE